MKLVLIPPGEGWSNFIMSHVWLSHVSYCFEAKHYVSYLISCLISIQTESLPPNDCQENTMVYKGMSGGCSFVSNDWRFGIESFFDYGSCRLNTISTIARCQYFGRSLVTWQWKKQKTIVSLSTCEAENVAASSFLGSLDPTTDAWLQFEFSNYLYLYITLLLHFTKTPVDHSKTKHIEYEVTSSMTATWRSW